MDWVRNAGIGLLELSFIPNPRQLLQAPLLLPFTSKLNSVTDEPSAPVCEHPGLSCPAHMPPKFDECCLNAPSGHFLSTQFWDTSPPLGANDTWTLHGLWPDYCTGGFDQYCDDSRSKSQHEIEAILEQASKSTHPELLDFMNKHWLSYDTRDSNLWTHEWNKHGTCISTLKPKCYVSKDSKLISSSSSMAPSSSEPKDILDYFTHATTLYTTLDTFKTLAKHDIVPSYEKTYKLSDLQEAFSKSEHARVPTLKCNPRHELQEVWYHFLVRGPLRDADPSLTTSNSSSIFVPTDADGQISNCPESGIKYLPKRGRAKPSPPGYGEPGPKPGPDPSPFRGSGFLKVHILSDGGYQARDERQRPGSADYKDGNGFTGCLIRSGKWYTSGTCATYTTKEDAKHIEDSSVDDQSDYDIDSRDTDQDHQQLQTSNKFVPNSTEDNNKDKSEYLFTLQSKLAPCSILTSNLPSKFGQPLQFTCATHLPIQSIFGVGNGTESETKFDTKRDEEEGREKKVLTYQNSSVFYADKIPTRFEQVGVFADDGDGKRKVRLEIHWEGL